MTQPKQYITIGVERPHDGLLSNGLLYFTTVDGHIVIVDPESLKVTSVLDLKEFRGDKLPGPAWCRGLLVINKNLVWVGFTRIRKTLMMEGLVVATIPLPSQLPRGMAAGTLAEITRRLT